jgi:hypothetical protein
VVVNGADAATDRQMISEIQAVAAAELLKRQRTLQDSSIVSDALSKLPNRECSDNDCLAQLARDTRSDCTAYFAVTPNAGRTVFLSARLIPGYDPDRPVFSRSEHYDRIGKTPKDWSISALQRFIRTVPLAKETAAPEITPLVPKSDGSHPPPDGQATTNPNPNPPNPNPPNLNPPAPSPIASAPPSTAMTPPPPGLDWRIPVGSGLAAVGVGAIISGVVLSNMAKDDWQNMLDSANNAPFPYGRTEDVLTAYRAAKGKMQLGSVGIVGGAGFTAAGAGLLAWQFLSPHKDHPASKVACGISAGGMRCSASFSFP